jgi:hypothetical protein
MKRKIPIAGIVIGAILILGPLCGFIAIFFGLQSAFSTPGESGIELPHALDSTIGAVLAFQHIGFITCPVGIALCIICVIILQALHRQPPSLPPRLGPLDFRE